MNQMQNNLMEPDEKLDQLARGVIGAAIEVHRALGPGLLESVYEKSLCIELAERSIPFVQQALVPLYYKQRPIGEGRVDILVGQQLVVELKAVDLLTDIYVAQLLTYLRVGGFRLGLLMNFNVSAWQTGFGGLYTPGNLGGPWRSWRLGGEST